MTNRRENRLLKDELKPYGDQTRDELLITMFNITDVNSVIPTNPLFLTDINLFTYFCLRFYNQNFLKNFTRLSIVQTITALFYVDVSFFYEIMEKSDISQRSDPHLQTVLLARLNNFNDYDLWREYFSSRGIMSQETVLFFMMKMQYSPLWLIENELVTSEQMNVFLSITRFCPMNVHEKILSSFQMTAIETFKFNVNITNLGQRLPRNAIYIDPLLRLFLIFNTHYLQGTVRILNQNKINFIESIAIVHRDINFDLRSVDFESFVSDDPEIVRITSRFVRAGMDGNIFDIFNSLTDSYKINPLVQACVVTLLSSIDQYEEFAQIAGDMLTPLAISVAMVKYYFDCINIYLNNGDFSTVSLRMLFFSILRYVSIDLLENVITTVPNLTDVELISIFSLCLDSEKILLYERCSYKSNQSVRMYILNTIEFDSLHRFVSVYQLSTLDIAILRGRGYFI